MDLPALVRYESEDEYRRHFESVYCRDGISTFDGIQVYFRRDQFRHAFYESTRRDGRKDSFSRIPAERIEWIKATLQHPEATLLQGWDRKNRRYDASRRVAVVYQDFVVVLALRPTLSGSLKARFITCFQADNSIGKIRESPTWSKEECLRALGCRP